MKQLFSPISIDNRWNLVFLIGTTFAACCVEHIPSHIMAIFREYGIGLALFVSSVTLIPYLLSSMNPVTYLYGITFRDARGKILDAKLPLFPLRLPIQLLSMGSPIIVMLVSAIADSNSKAALLVLSMFLTIPLSYFIYNRLPTKYSIIRLLPFFALIYPLSITILAFIDASPLAALVGLIFAGPTFHFMHIDCPISLMFNKNAYQTAMIGMKFVAQPYPKRRNSSSDNFERDLLQSKGSMQSRR